MHSLIEDPNEAERLQPVKKMFPQKVVGFVVIAKNDVTPPKVVCPISTRILDLWGKRLLNVALLYCAYQYARMLKVANVFLELRHKVETIGK